MESDKNPFPEIDIVPTKVRQMAQAFGSFIMGRREVPLCESDHYVKEHFEPSDGEAMLPADTGAEAMLSRLIREGQEHKKSGA